MSQNSGLCDLHMHSTRSDGTDSPTRLVELAAEAGLEAIAVSDHDTTDALEESVEAGRRLGVRVLSAVEISVEHAGKTVHMLGYCFNTGVEKLRAGLAAIRDGRDDRNRRIIKRLQDLGLDVTYQEIAAEAGPENAVIGRPHFASVMLKRGFVATRQEVFDKYLGKGGLAYEERLRFDPKDSIGMIQEAGGIAVLAHPKLVRFAEFETMEIFLQGLVDAGLRGIECHYSLHTPEETDFYLALAEEHNLVVTGGSDYHGLNKPDIKMGTGLGNLQVPISCANALEAASGGARVPRGGDGLE